MFSPPLSNCHRTFLKIKEIFHTLAVTSTLSLCLSLNNTHTHAHFILKEKKKDTLWGLSKDIPLNKLNYIQPHAHLLSNRLYSLLMLWGKVAR